MNYFPNGHRVAACGFGVVFFLLLCFALARCSFAQVPCPSIEVCFSPLGGCMASIVREIDSAKENIYVQAYSIESGSIRNALVSAYKRGVEVKIILDRKRRVIGANESVHFDEAGIIVRFDLKHPIAHDKTMVIDGGCVITGSYNFSENGDKLNAENILIIRDSKTASRYSANWSRHWEHSQEYVSKGVR